MERGRLRHHRNMDEGWKCMEMWDHPHRQTVLKRVFLGFNHLQTVRSVSIVKGFDSVIKLARAFLTCFLTRGDGFKEPSNSNLGETRGSEDLGIDLAETLGDDFQKSKSI